MAKRADHAVSESELLLTMVSGSYNWKFKDTCGLFETNDSEMLP